MTIVRGLPGFATGTILGALLLACLTLSVLRAEEIATDRLFTHIRIPAPVDDGGGVPAPIAPRAAGFVIVPTFGSSITSDPRSADIMATINAAIAVYQKTISDPATISIRFEKVSTGLGASSTFFGTFPYSTYRAALAARATSDDDTTALAHIPSAAANPVNGDPNINVTTALARTMALTGGATNPPAGQADCTISLNIAITNITPADTDTKKFSLMSVASHEIDEALGMGSSLDGGTSGPIRPEDLFRYGSNGARIYSNDPQAASFFSLDGTTKLVQFNQDKNGDFGDWFSVNGGQKTQVQDAFTGPGVAPVLGVELRVLDAIGYRLWTSTPPPSGIPGTNLPPVITSAAALMPSLVSMNTAASFTVGATDPDNDRLTVTWDFGDGGTGSGMSTTHTYNTPGTFLATATVTDGNGGSVSSSVQVTVIIALFPAINIKQNFKLNFKGGSDAIDITLFSKSFFVPADGSTIRFMIGDMNSNSGVPLDSGVLFKNKAAGSIGKFTVSTRNGTVRYSTKAASLQALLAPFGAVNQNVSQQISVPIFVFYNGQYNGGTFSFSYVGKQGVSGTGK